MYVSLKRTGKHLRTRVCAFTISAASVVTLALFLPAGAHASGPDNSALAPAERALQLAHRIAIQVESPAGRPPASSSLPVSAGAATSSSAAPPAAVAAPRPAPGPPASAAPAGATSTGSDAPVTPATRTPTPPNAAAAPDGAAGMPSAVPLPVVVKPPTARSIATRVAEAKRSLLTRMGVTTSVGATVRARLHGSEIEGVEVPVVTHEQPSAATTPPANPQPRIAGLTEWPAPDNPTLDPGFVPSYPTAESMAEVATVLPSGDANRRATQRALTRHTASEPGVAGTTSGIGPQGSPEATSAPTSEGLDGARRTRRHAAERASESTGSGVTTLSGSLLPASSAATAGGGTGLAAPAVALLAVAVLGLLASLSRRRLNSDLLPWKSTLLSLRLERPG